MSLRVSVGGWTAGGFAWPECRLPTCTTLLIGLRAVGELSPQPECLQGVVVLVPGPSMAVPARHCHLHTDRSPHGGVRSERSLLQSMRVAGPLAFSAWPECRHAFTGYGQIE